MMIDLETCGVKIDTKILSICISIFNLNGIKEEFYATLEDQPERSTCISTMLWWEKHPQAFKCATDSKNKITVQDLRLKIFELWHTYSCTKVFSYPSTFDIVILENMFEVPWFHTQKNCARSCLSDIFCPVSKLKEIYINSKESVENLDVFEDEKLYTGTVMPHHPVYDCRLQIFQIINYSNIVTFL